MGFLTTTDTAKTPRRLEMTRQAMTDLMLDSYLGRIFEGHHGSKPLDWPSFLTCDTEDLLYRREVLTELEKDTALVSDIEEVCKTISQIHQLQSMPASSEFYAESIRERSIKEPGRAGEMLKEHRAILEAIREKDEKKAGELMSCHIQNAAANIQKNHLADTFE